MAIRLARSGIADENLRQVQAPERTGDTDYQFRPGKMRRKTKVCLEGARLQAADKLNAGPSLGSAGLQARVAKGFEAGFSR